MMMGIGRDRKLALAAIVLGLLAALITGACTGGGSGDGEPPEGISVIVTSPRETTPAERSTPSPTPTPTPSPTPLRVCGPNPDPADPKQLQVIEPSPDARVKIPFHVRGWGSTIGKDNIGVALAIVDARQQVLQVLDLPPQPRTYRVVPPGLEITEFTRPFAADVVLDPVREPTPICLWVYQETTEDGTPKDVVQVQVVVMP
jgi:hypothetical protein